MIAEYLVKHFNERTIKVIVFFMFITTVTIVHKYNKYKTSYGENYTENYFENFDYKFSGIVEDYKHIEGGKGILYLNNDSIISREYDPRDSLTYYCCIIKSKKSEIILYNFNEYKVGDHVFVDGPKKEILNYRNNKLVYKNDLELLMFFLFSKEARWYHKI